MNGSTGGGKKKCEGNAVCEYEKSRQSLSIGISIETSAVAMPSAVSTAGNSFLIVGRRSN